jgi:hypothetical protein
MLVVTASACASDTDPSPTNGATEVEGKADGAASDLYQQLLAKRGWTGGAPGHGLPYVPVLRFEGRTLEGTEHDETRDESYRVEARLRCHFELTISGEWVQVSFATGWGRRDFSLAKSSESFVANGFSTSWSDERTSDGEVYRRIDHTSWFDQEASALSTISDSRPVATDLIGLNTLFEDSITQTLYVGVTSDRSGITQIRYTRSIDDEQVAVIDCHEFRPI